MTRSVRLRELAEQRVGSQLRRGKYTLEELIGVGSMAAVYRATHRNGSLVAVKVLHTDLVGDDDIHARFLREGYIVNQVNHPGVVKVLDDDVDDNGATFLVLELLLGRTLEEEREALGGKVPPLQLLRIMREVLLVLAAVHAAGVVHRDVKPENIFLTNAGPVKLLDLGVARLGTKSRFTEAGHAIGSPAYMAPEQAAGLIDEIDARTDLFGVGATLFTLLTGEWVHDAPNARARLHLAATRQARSLFEVWPDAKGALANVVDVALRFDKTQRWSSAEDMSRAVESVLKLMLPSVYPPAAPAAVRPNWQVGVHPVAAFPPQAAVPAFTPVQAAAPQAAVPPVSPREHAPTPPGTVRMPRFAAPVGPSKTPTNPRGKTTPRPIVPIAPVVIVAQQASPPVVPEPAPAPPAPPEPTGLTARTTLAGWPAMSDRRAKKREKK